MFALFFLFFVATWADQDYISGSECVKRKVCCALSCLPMLVTLHFICMYASTCHKVCMLQTFWWQFSVLRIIVAQRLHSFSSLLVKSPKSRTRWSLLVTKGVIIFSRCSFSTTCSYLLHCLVSVFIHSSLPFQEFTLNKYIWTMWCTGVILFKDFLFLKVVISRRLRYLFTTN